MDYGELASLSLPGRRAGGDVGRRAPRGMAMAGRAGPGAGRARGRGAGQFSLLATKVAHTGSEETRPLKKSSLELDPLQLLVSYTYLYPIQYCQYYSLLPIYSLRYLYLVVHYTKEQIKALLKLEPI